MFHSSIESCDPLQKSDRLAGLTARHASRWQSRPWPATLDLFLQQLQDEFVRKNWEMSCIYLYDLCLSHLCVQHHHSVSTHGHTSLLLQNTRPRNTRTCTLHMSPKSPHDWALSTPNNGHQTHRCTTWQWRMLQLGVCLHVQLQSGSLCALCSGFYCDNNAHFLNYLYTYHSRFYDRLLKTQVERCTGPFLFN